MHRKVLVLILVCSVALVISVLVVRADFIVGANQIDAYVRAVNLLGMNCAQVNGIWTFWYDETTAQFVTTQPYNPIWHAIPDSYCFGYSAYVTYTTASSSTTQLYGQYEFKISSPFETVTGTVELYIFPWGSSHVQVLTYYGSQPTNDIVFNVPVDTEVNAY